MKALQFQTFGSPDVLQLVDLPTPQPADGYAVVQVRSASINPSDVKNLAGHFSHTVPPRVPGRDFAGVVVNGPAEWVGKSVWGTGGDIGFTMDGTHAEYIQVPVQALVAMPSTLSFEQAAAIGVNFVVAWLGTVQYAQLRAGETIAVIGAGGGVGGAVVQLAKAIGAQAIGIDRHPLPAGSPAAQRIDRYVPFGDDAVAQVQALGGVDVVYDAVGGVAFEMALGLVKRRGRVVEISATGKRRVDFDLIDFYHNETQLFGADSAKLGVVESAPMLAALVPHFEEGRLQPPVIAARYPLEQGREAYEAVKAGTAGRVVITM